VFTGFLIVSEHFVDATIIYGGLEKTLNVPKVFFLELEPLAEIGLGGGNRH